MRNRYPIKLGKQMWGGFSDGRLDLQLVDDKFGGKNERHVPALFTSRKAALDQYDDVRKVGLTEFVSKPGRRSR